MDLSTAAPLLLTLLVGVVLGALLGVLWARGRASDDRDLWEARAADQGVVREGLERLADQLRELDHQRVSWQSQLHQQVQHMRETTAELGRETRSLSTALRKPQVRGRWGEMHLRRAVELAGLIDRCDFTEQARLDDGALRPDLVVSLAGGRSVVVDAKVPLDAFLDATGTDDPDEAAAHLARHARQLRTHAETLGAKTYWRSLADTPEFVVLFVPGDSFLAAALEAEPTLLEHAAARQVVIATPTTLIALLRTVAMGWSQVTLAERTREVHELGRQLHERLGTMGGHLDKLGRSLRSSVEAYNRTVGSLESRVLVSARSFADLGVTDAELPGPEPVRDTPRALTSAELLDAVTRDDDDWMLPLERTPERPAEERPTGT